MRSLDTRPSSLTTLRSRTVSSRYAALFAVTIAASVATGCGGQSGQSSVHFVAEDTFVMSPSDIAEVAPAPWVLPWRDPELGVRTAVALEHNCPLEGVTVLVARESGASVRFTVRACGVERVYQEFEDLGFIDVSRAVASAIVPEIAPPIAPLPTPPNTNPNSPAAPDVTPPNAPGSAPSPSPSEPKR